MAILIGPLISYGGICLMRKKGVVANIKKKNLYSVLRNYGALLPYAGMDTDSSSLRSKAASAANGTSERKHYTLQQKVSLASAF